MSERDPDDFYEDDEEDEDDALESECGSFGDGQCSLAGTEWCDWSCPLHDEVFAKAIRRVKRGDQP